MQAVYGYLRYLKVSDTERISQNARFKNRGFQLTKRNLLSWWKFYREFPEMSRFSITHFLEWHNLKNYSAKPLLLDLYYTDLVNPGGTRC